MNSTSGNATGGWRGASATKRCAWASDDGVLLLPGSVHTGNQQMYKVYTPFRNAFPEPA